jgi:hypothetical protein
VEAAFRPWNAAMEAEPQEPPTPAPQLTPSLAAI